MAVRAATRFHVIDGCYISNYSTGSHGYAQVGWNEGTERFGTTAHRAAWVIRGEQIPVDMTIDHVCKNRRCVRLEHLRVLSNYENARRTSGRDWDLGQCAHGHPNQEASVDPSGKRICRPCKKRWSQSYRERRQVASFDLSEGAD